MNKLVGKIAAIESNGHLSIVTVFVGSDIKIKSIVIETPDSLPYLRLDTMVNLLFKETEMILTKDPTVRLSIDNSIPCQVMQIERGKLLSSVKLRCSGGTIDAIISTDTMDAMEIRQEMPVWAMVELNEIMLSEL